LRKVNGDSHHGDVKIYTSVKKGDWGYGDSWTSGRDKTDVILNFIDLK
jgi:hypothetical protein